MHPIQFNTLSKKTNSIFRFFIIAGIAISGFHCQSIKQKVGPDYIITNFTFPTTPQAVGALFSGNISFKVSNVGTQDGTQPVNITLYMSAYQYYDSGSTLCPTIATPPIVIPITISPLKAGQSSSTLTFAGFTIDQAYANNFYLLKIATSDKEADTFNNVSSSSPVTISGGQTLPTEVKINNGYLTYNISSFQTQNYFFNTTANHAYMIFWDDFSDGTLMGLPTSADVKVSSYDNNSLGATTFFTSIDNGFTIPQTVYSPPTTTKIFIDVSSATSPGTQYALRVDDIGIPPNLSISILNPTVNSAGGITTLKFDYVITNNSVVDAKGPFTVGFWANLLGPSLGTPVDYSLVIPSTTTIAAGTSLPAATISISSPATTTRIAYGYVDLNNDIAENNESDNFSAGLSW